jgi:hypothetical protein
MRNWVAAAAALAAVAVIAVLLAAGIPTAVQASGMYYVDQNHPAASDANPGTASLPWETLSHAAGTATAGDTVLVKAGTYAERVNPSNSGAPGAWITFKADPPGSVTMHGFYTYGSDYLWIEGFRVTHNPALTGWTEKYGVFIRSDHVAVVDNTFVDLPATAIQGYWHDPYPHDAYVAGNLISRSQMGLGITGFNWLVEQNEVHRLVNYGGGDSDYARFFGDGHLIRDNTFHGTLPAEIGAAHVDCFQTFDNNGEFSHNVTVEGNWCSDFHQGFMGEAHFYHDISHLTFKNNVFAHGWAWGLAVEDISYLTAVNNTFFDIEHHGIGLSGPFAHHAVIENNIFFDTGTSYWFPSGSDSSGDHNLIYLSQAPPVSGPHDLVNVDPAFVDPGGDDLHLKLESPAIDAGAQRPDVDRDFEDWPRPSGGGWDLGAFEFHPDLFLRGIAGNGSIHLTWSVNVSLPVTATWQLAYDGPPGAEPSPIEDIPSSTWDYGLLELTNYSLYTVTLVNIQGGQPAMTETLSLMPTDHAGYLSLAPYVEP